jgi:hypothetical protein
MNPFVSGPAFNPRPEKRDAHGNEIKPSKIEGFMDAIADLEYAKEDIACMKNIGMETSQHEVKLRVIERQMEFLQSILVAQNSAPITYRY